MIDLEFIERLIRAIDDSGLDSLELERGGTRVRLSKTPAASGGAETVSVTSASAPAPHPAAAPGAAASGETAAAAPTEEAGVPKGIDVTSPMVGTFYRAPAPDAPPYVEVGTRVAKGDTLCIIEAMKLMNELECELAGTIVEVLVENAQPVEFGQVLFRIEPT